MLLHNVAELLTNKLYKVCRLEDAKKPVYIYGFEITLSTILSVLPIFLISAFFSMISSALVFLLFFCPLRLFSGGYHAETYSRCFVLTNVVYLFIVIFSLSVERLSQPVVSSLIGAALLLFSVTTIFLLAPTRNKHHPLSSKSYARNRIAARILSVIFIGIATIGYRLFGERCFLFISFTITAVAVLMIVPKFQERRA